MVFHVTVWYCMALYFVTFYCIVLCDITSCYMLLHWYCIRTLPRGGMYWEIHPPRPERLPEGEARGQSRGSRGAKSPPEGNLEGRGGCIFRYIPTRGSVRTFFHSRQGGIRSNTVRLQVCLVTTSVLLSRLDKSGCAWISVRLWITRL